MSFIKVGKIINRKSFLDKFGNAVANTKVRNIRNGEYLGAYSKGNKTVTVRIFKNNHCRLVKVGLNIKRKEEDRGDFLLSGTEICGESLESKIERYAEKFLILSIKLNYEVGFIS